MSSGDGTGGGGRCTCVPPRLTWQGWSWHVGQLPTPCACRSSSPNATSSFWMRSCRTQPVGHGGVGGVGNTFSPPKPTAQAPQPVAHPQSLG